MTTPTLAERLEEIRRRCDGPLVVPWSVASRDLDFLLGILSRLGDEKVIEAAAREIDPIAWLDTPLTAEQDIARAGCRKQSLTDARAALSAGLTAAMMEGKDG